jgi:hypothetical protein
MFKTARSRIRLALASVGLAAGVLALASPLSASADSLGPFSCTDKSGGATAQRGTVSAIRVAHHDGYDRLVIGFATSNAMPAYQLTRQNSATFIRDASGQPATLEGSAGIRVVLQNSDIADGVPADLKPRLPEIREVANIGNFERVVSYGVGLHDAACFRVLELSSPTRLVIDVQTPPDAAAANPTASAPAASTTQPSASTAPESSLPSDLAATGHPASANQQSSMPLAILLGLLAVTAGLTILGLRRFARK